MLDEYCPMCPMLLGLGFQEARVPALILGGTPQRQLRRSNPHMKGSVCTT